MMRVRGKLNPALDPRNRVMSLRESFRLTSPEAKDILRSLDSLFVREEKKLFSSEGSSGGSKWKALDPAYAKQKKRALGGALRQMRSENRSIGRMTGRRPRTPSLKSANKILQFTGEMADSFRKLKHPDHVATFSLRPRILFKLGSRNELAQYHAEGRPPMPRRDPLQMTGGTRSKYFKLAQRGFEQKLRRVMRAMKALTRDLGRSA